MGHNHDGNSVPISTGLEVAKRHASRTSPSHGPAAVPPQCPATAESAKDATGIMQLTPQEGQLYPLGQPSGWLEAGTGAMACDRCGGGGPVLALQSSNQQPQPSVAPLGSIRTTGDDMLPVGGLLRNGVPQRNGEERGQLDVTDLRQDYGQPQQPRRRLTRRHLGHEEFLHQYDTLLEAQEAAVGSAASKPSIKRSRKRKHPGPGPAPAEAGTADAVLPNAVPGIGLVEDGVQAAVPAPAARARRRGSPAVQRLSEPSFSCAATPAPSTPVVAGEHPARHLTGVNSVAAATSNAKASTTTTGRRPRLLSLYSEFGMAQGAALGRMPPGSGQSAWDQTRTHAATATGSRPRSRRSSSSGAGTAVQAGTWDSQPARDLEEPWTAQEKIEFWQNICSFGEGEAEVSGADDSEGIMASNPRHRVPLSLAGTPVLICVRQPEPYGPAELYELPDLGIGPMDDATWEIWGRQQGSSRPCQPLMVVDVGARLGFELCAPHNRGSGGWRTYEVIVGSGYSHDPARTLHPLRLVCEGRVRFDARHLWDLVDFLADPTRASIAAHLTSAALLRTGRDREAYYPPSFCHWLLLRRWGERGLAHVGWGPGDTLRHVNEVRRRRLPREEPVLAGPGKNMATGAAAKGVEQCR
ncbi:hypothetical protein VOLCADRAFT_104415 [Volvox carteri f. nagariensis]|uniref:Uncharacterized protein n=1 Tax=Volvox carteri f. nagariensis TaxID=3068 RepID=D8TTH5_VOLCA|nr:uncharacterized protein VOLCADRAFT_104415 [Volvox carteri f. nagariensis]EFJ49308.1 hypothetical protein VOLCADRAFT_104415 [Volvox carteri f. nagariensis]|eukprot:XP_002949756.1 hypothetical protein VOLCADRAFT_104415 [Volvox carteri f. nagariensis]